jgi:acyl carrier protein
MDLEADLGIDSIKRVEILSALQERFPETPAVEPEALGTLDTLRQVLEHVGAAAPATTVAAPSGSFDADGLQAVLLAVVAEKTGYPQDILELDMDLEADLGIDSIKRVEILSAVQDRFPDAPAVEPEALGSLDTLRQVLDHMSAASAPRAPEAPANAPAQAPASEPVEAEETNLSATAGVERSLPETVAVHGPRETIALPDNAKAWVAGTGDALSQAVVERLQQRGLDASFVDLADRESRQIPRVLRALVVIAPETGADEAFLKQAFFFVQDCASSLRAVGPSVLATVSRLDGRFGLGDWNEQAEPMAGGLAGLAKTAEREWDEVLCKALDLSPELSVEDASQVVGDELLLSGPVEVGADPEGRWALRLASSEPTTNGRDPLEAGDLVVVSGGARGVTADCVVALAEAFQPALLLLGRSAPPTEEAAWLRELDGEAAIKKALLEHEGPRSPRELGERYAELAANREVLRTLERIRATGAGAEYAQVDVRDAQQLESTLGEAVKAHGPVRGLVHGAGVLADQLIEDKTEEAWDRVMGTKVGGLRALLAAIHGLAASPDELRVMALFSSSTARFGRKGQVDYAVANEVMNKTAQQQQALRPGCRVASIGWGPWDGGMVTPALRKIFQAEGVEVIAVPVGAKHFVDELREAPGAPVESVVLGGEVVPQPELAGRHGESEGAPLETAFSRKLKLEDHAILASHVMKGRAVLPAAIMIEWLAHAALHANPGMCLHGLDSLRVLKGVVVDPDSPPTVRALAGPPRREGELLAVPVELRGTGSSGREFLHARAEILLASALPAAPPAAPAPTLEAYPDADDVYEKVLFHGPDLQGLTTIEGISDEGIAAGVRSAPSPKTWLAKPLRGSWLADPLAIDCAFQALIAWSSDRKGAASLPVYVGAYRQYRRSFPRDGVRLVATITKSSAGRALSNIDFLDADGAVVARIEDYECVIDASLAAAFRQNRLVGRASQ